MFFVWLNVQRSDLPSLLASSVSTQPRSTPRRGLASCWTHSEASLVLHLRVSHFFSKSMANYELDVFRLA